MSWVPTSWKQKPATQQATYADPEALARVVDEMDPQRPAHGPQEPRGNPRNEFLFLHERFSPVLRKMSGTENLRGAIGEAAIFVGDKTHMGEGFDPGALFAGLDPAENFRHEVFAKARIEAFKNGGPPEETVGIRHLP